SEERRVGKECRSRWSPGHGIKKGELYMLEDTALISNSSCSFTSAFALNNDVLWHARLGHPHVRALSLMLPGVMVKNNDCEACILGKHCKTVFQKSNTIYENCFDLVHSDVWTVFFFKQKTAYEIFT